MADIDQELAQMTDAGLATLHGRLDESDPSVAAEAQAHHLVTTEILRRGGSHGHDGDDWGKTVILVDSVEVESAEDIAAPDGMEKAWGEALADGGTVSVMLTVNGYVLKADPTVSEVHVDSVMGKPRRRKAKRVMVDELTDYEKRAVPEVFADLDRNLENRQHAIDEYLYGPMNPEEPGDYWRRLGDMWDVSAAEAATTRCGNCAAFNVSLGIRSAMAEAIGEGGEQVVASADLGYCELLDFKCAASRSCSAWLTGGPITSDGEDDESGYEKSEEDFLASLDDDALAWYGDIGFLIGNDRDPELLLQKAGNPEPLREYWRGGGKGKIAWGAGGDFTSCVAAVSKYMNSEQAKGYCAIRHREVTGMWPGDKRNRMGKNADVLKHGKHDQSSHGKRGGGASAGYGETAGKKEDEPSRWTAGMPIPPLVKDHAPGTMKDDDGNLMPRSPEASSEATSLRARSEALEPATTAMVTKMAAEHGGEMTGLEQRLKTADSLARKIDADAVKEHGGDREAAAASVSDSIRYTTVFDNDTYTAGAAATLKSLEADGYSIRAKNFWSDGDDYQGMNVKATKDGVTVELQFHTRDSVRVKETQLHPVYEEYRKSTDNTKRRELWDKMVGIASTIPKPAGYATLLTIGTLTVKNFETAQQAGLLG